MRSTTTPCRKTSTTIRSCSCTLASTWTRTWRTGISAITYRTLRTTPRRRGLSSGFRSCAGKEETSWSQNLCQKPRAEIVSKTTWSQLASETTCSKFASKTTCAQNLRQCFRWRRNNDCIMMLVNNSSVQVNFLEDHKKVR